MHIRVRHFVKWQAKKTENSGRVGGMNDGFEKIKAIKHNRLTVEPGGREELIRNAGLFKRVHEWFGMGIGAHEYGEVIPDHRFFITDLTDFIYNASHLVIGSDKV